MTAFIEFDVTNRGLHEITDRVQAVVKASGLMAGVCVLFIQPTSASLTIQENADPSARHDLEHWLSRVISDDDPAWTHVAEGADDMPAHVRAMLTDVSLSIPIIEGRLALGRWQGIYLCEHRLGPHRRRVAIAITPSLEISQRSMT